MKHTEYTIELTYEDTMRIYFEQHRGKIIKFIVQYYSLISQKEKTIMRIDNCHGYPHQHVYYLRKRERVLPWIESQNEALTKAQKLIKNNFKKIKENYLLTK